MDKEEPLKSIIYTSLILMGFSNFTAFSSSLKHHHVHHYSKSSRAKRQTPNGWAPMYPPTHASLLAQNAEIDRLQLPRIQNDAELKELITEGALIPIPTGEHLIVDRHLPSNRRYCRPWTSQFLIDLSDAFYQNFNEPIMVDSAVRTVEVQNKLRRWNGNAAPSEGETASSHLAGLTVDLARRRMTKEQIQFVELWLLPLYMDHLVEVEEENHQLCFHIMVSKDYPTTREISLQ
jgi:hypothetical protein